METEENARNCLVPIIIQTRNFPLFIGFSDMDKNSIDKIGTKAYSK